jgi:2-alkyl-3-oxoalkanoate reductase
MNIFITGGAGFIGAHLVSSLAEEGHVVYVLTRNKDKAKNLESKNIILIQGDIEKPSSYEKVFDNHIDIVYHLAAAPGQKWKFDDDDYQKINVDGTRHLLELSRNKIKKFIFCSSINAIENSTGFHKNSYGKSKLEGEKLVKKENGFEAIILRPAIVYGPGDTGGMFLKMCSMVKKGAFFLIGSGKNILPVVYISDLVHAFLLAKDASQDKQVFEIAGPDDVSIGKITAIISECLKVNYRKMHVPVWIARLAAFFSETFSAVFKVEPVITNHRIDLMVKSNPISSEKARIKLGYSPKVKFEEGIKITISWYKENGFI